MLSRLTGSKGPSRAPSPPTDPLASGKFPLCAATHDLGIRRFFDLGTLLLLLDCRPGDTVLDLGAGPGFSSEVLARLGYDVVALDPDDVHLLHTRRRATYDRDRVDGSIRVVQGVAEALPLANESVDGVLGMNVLHHVPQVVGTLDELARVLRPGCRAVFVEPGTDHLSEPETQRACREHGENDEAFDVLEYLKQAKTRGFKHAMLTATLQSALRLLPIEEVELYLSGHHHRPHMTPHGVIDELHRRHAYCMLERNGDRPKTTRHPGQLRCSLSVCGFPESITSGCDVAFWVDIDNTGDTPWRSRASRIGGYVTVGCKLLDANGRLITDTLGRTPLESDVAPGGSHRTKIAFRFPTLAAGRYTLVVDLVNELICWFSDLPDATPTLVSFVVLN